MRRRATTATFVLLAASGLALGGGLSAWAAMVIVSDPAVATVHAPTIPAPDAPSVKLVGGLPQISWNGVRVTAEVPVDRYVVVRHDDGRTDVACAVGGAVRRCRDQGARPGATLTYSLHAAMGSGWRGPDSSPSDEIAIPVPKVVRGAAPQADSAPSATPAPVPTEPTGAAPDAIEPSSTGLPAAVAPTTPSPVATADDGTPSGRPSAGS